MNKITSLKDEVPTIFEDQYDLKDFFEVIDTCFEWKAGTYVYREGFDQQRTRKLAKQYLTTKGLKLLK